MPRRWNRRSQTLQHPQAQAIPEVIKIENDSDKESIATAESSDPEIRHMQQNLHSLRHQRRKLELQARIAEEERLLVEIQQRLAHGDLFPVAEHPFGPESPATDFRPEPPNVEPYCGESLREFYNFMAGMEGYFFQYENFFTTDVRKVATATSMLSSDMLRKWYNHRAVISPEQHTWQEFYSFFLDWTNHNPLNIRRARKQYDKALQRRSESVRDFATYLARLEARCAGRRAEWQKIENLRARVIRDIRVQSLSYNSEPTTYEAFVSHLCMVEITIPSRRAFLRR